jgi:hypothetical protein
MKKQRRTLPPFMLKGANAMLEDAKYLESGLKNNKDIKTATTMQEARNQLLDLVARHQIVHLVGNQFLSCSSSRNKKSKNKSSLSSWPTIEMQSRILLLPQKTPTLSSSTSSRRFNFEHLFDTHRTYMNPDEQLGSIALNGVYSFSELGDLIEKQIVPSLVQQSEILSRNNDDDDLSSFSCSTTSAGSGLAVWSISPALHRVIIRTVLLEHILASSSSSGVFDDNEDTAKNLVRNLQTMIVNMQASFFSQKQFLQSFFLRN